MTVSSPFPAISFFSAVVGGEDLRNRSLRSILVRSGAAYVRGHGFVGEGSEQVAVQLRYGLLPGSE